MSEVQHFRYSGRVITVPLGLVLGIWSVYMLELRLGLNLNSWGIYPRDLQGLRGVFTSPWIHGSLDHLYNNTLPLAILTAALFYFYRPIAWRTLIWGTLLTGILTWCIGRPSYHIGASGVIYLLASFIFFKGILTRHYRLVALSLGVVFLYGSLLWYIFPVKEGISWEGHLSGAVSGLIFAALLRVRLPSPPKYDWEREDYREDDDPFMQHFDRDGNFIETPGASDEGPAAWEAEASTGVGNIAGGARTSTGAGNASEPDQNKGEGGSRSGGGVRIRYHYRTDRDSGSSPE
ncbi:rhomboid family intramembrane serine protease [Robiginitalea sp. SC105]|uniref:rhomboid family intramembrane serine protease n=1 Tax=Robiginitalea sp. SC105 TaxID=2762332 RepID=UPI00163A369E|nr:rhomboid family intramembrane serine protease [Robiginitalea sp. SC105]MBC2839609.1 rhomboid family intramembrane serine protease [Robiginitalea sp. SC105]